MVMSAWKLVLLTRSSRPRHEASIFWNFSLWRISFICVSMSSSMRAMAFITSPLSKRTCPTSSLMGSTL